MNNSQTPLAPMLRIACAVPALADEVQVELPDRRSESVRVVARPFRPVAVACAHAVADGAECAAATPYAVAEMGERQRCSVVEHRFDGLGEGSAGADDRERSGIARGRESVLAEHRVRV